MTLFDSTAPWASLLNAKTLKSWSDDIVIIDALANFPETIQPHKTIVVARDLDIRDYAATLIYRDIRHVIQVGDPHFAEQIDKSGELIASPQRFTEDPASFTLRNESDPAQKIAIDHWNFTSLTDKLNVLTEIEKCLLNERVSSAAVQTSCSVADELFTNALFWGLRKQTKVTAKQPHSLNERIVYPNGFQARMTLARDGQSICIVCEDPFGMLQAQDILSPLYKSLEKDVQAVMKTGEGPAGIGYIMIFRVGVSINIAVQPGSRTIVACQFPIDLRFKQLGNMPHHFRYIEF